MAALLAAQNEYADEVVDDENIKVSTVTIQVFVNGTCANVLPHS